MQGYVYLMRLEQDLRPHMCAYKIGRSVKPSTRQAQIALVLPYDLTLVHSIYSSDMVWAEDYMHWAFFTWNLRGEWFGGMYQEQIDWFCSLKTIEPNTVIDPDWYLHPLDVYRSLRYSY